MADNKVLYNPEQMEKTVKIWQALVATVALLVTVMGGIISQSNKIETQKLRIEFLESISRDLGLQMKSLTQESNAQYKEINSKLTDILVGMQNKEDRSKH